MQFLLSEFYEFCGYKGLPYGLWNKKTGDCFFFGKEDFELLYRLSSGADTEGLSLNDAQRGVISHYVKDQVLVPVDPATKGSATLPKYHRYPNRYKESVHWSITGKCNSKCRHCFQSAPDAVFGEPTLEQCLEIIRQFRECGVFHVDITGGEPLIRPDFWQIIDAILENGLHVGTIYSNGYLINQEFLDEFAKRGIKPAFQISFDGVGSHDWMRGIEGAEKMALNAIQLLVKNGYPVSSACSLFRESATTLLETIHLLASLGVQYLKCGSMMRQGLWLNYLDHDLTNEEMLALYKKVIPQYLADGRPITLQIEGFFMGYSDRYLANEDSAKDPAESKDPAECYRFFQDKVLSPEDHDKCDACESLRHSFYLGPSGNVVPCMGFDGAPSMVNAPNIFRMPLSEILTDSEYIKYAYVSVLDVEQHNPECLDCKWRYQCCAGCRAMAIATTPEDYLGIDRRTCMMLKENWTGQVMEAIKNFPEANNTVISKE